MDWDVVGILMCILGGIGLVIGVFNTAILLLSMALVFIIAIISGVDALHNLWKKR